METFISIVIWTLALYGLFEIIKNIISGTPVMEVR